MRRQKTTPSTIVPTRLSSVTTSPAPMSPRSYVAAGFERAAEMGSGADAVLGYERWTDSRNPAELEAIARYNEEDCRATLALRDWLVAVRPATAARLAPVPATGTRRGDGRSGQRAGGANAARSRKCPSNTVSVHRPGRGRRAGQDDKLGRVGRRISAVWRRCRP